MDGISNSSDLSNKSALTYTKLSDRVFFWVTLVLHVSTLGMALLIEDLDSVFEFISAFGTSFIMLLYPGLIYILAVRKFGKYS